MRKTYVSIEDVLRSPWVSERPTEQKPSVTDRVLRSTKLEDSIYADLRGADEALDAVERTAGEKLRSFPALSRDVYQSFYSLMPRRREDAELSAAEVDPDAVRKAKVFHFGSISLIGPESREATWRALHAARAAGVLVSYDPNYRASLWPDEQTAVSRMKEPLEYADLVKLSEEELRLLTGTDDLEQGSRSLSEAGIPLVLVTLGGKGAFYRLGAHCGQVQGVRTKVADTNGAGDTFLGAVLYQLCSRGIRMPDDITVPVLEEIIGFANRAASVTCSRNGAIPAMPTLEEI